MSLRMKDCRSDLHVGDRQLPTTQFHKDSSKSDGLCSYCCACSKLSGQQEYRRNKQRYKATAHIHVHSSTDNIVSSWQYYK